MLNCPPLILVIEYLLICKLYINHYAIPDIRDSHPLHIDDLSHTIRSVAVEHAII